MIRIGLTSGDPAGIGLEVLVRTLPALLSRAQWVLFTDMADFESACARHHASMEWERLHSIEALDHTDRPGLWLHSTSQSGQAIRPGEGSVESGRRAIEALGQAADCALAGRIHGIVTAPLSKRLVGEGFVGQTEFLGARSGSRHVAMSFFTPSFKVVLATTHVALGCALDRLTVELYDRMLTLIDREFCALGYSRPRIAVAGINPHAGEDGMFGNDENEILRPAIRSAVGRGLNVTGPWSPDTCYLRAHLGEWDVVLAPYHDQGLIPVKLIAPGQSTNVTLGLPYIRTSPDHGTAFEIAGQGVARTDGMKSALEWALELVNRRMKPVGAA